EAGFAQRGRRLVDHAVLRGSPVLEREVEARELELDADHIRRERAQRFLEQLLAGFVAFEQDDSVRIHGASVGGFGGATQPLFRQALLVSGITAVLRRTTGLNMARRGGWRRVGSRRRFRYVDSRGRPI